MFIVIEIVNPTWPAICTDEDGSPLLFDSREEAQEEAVECQKGIVVEY